MKKLLFILLVFAAGLLSYSQSAKEDKMPITTSSKSSLAFYNEALKCFEEGGGFAKGFNLLQKSIIEDPDFFIANYMIAYSNLDSTEKFNKYANAAINSKAKLSKAEELLKSTIQKFTEKKDADVTEIGRKLVAMYPKDVWAYYFLNGFQITVGDRQGSVETLQNALKISENPAPIYNLLGYAYMQVNQNNEAEAAFNKYIELAPKNPNVYDSKGDFYMNIKDYNKAYETYMKAYALDTAWSYTKAQQAKKLSEGKIVK
ncbi:MAG: tetratricopeptide repeat protein [ANME-2 cluster archaeon]|nr:MAG: tetratricopeptide repeat protein [ANME-2 cluster archaeon]